MDDTTNTTMTGTGFQHGDQTNNETSVRDNLGNVKDRVRDQAEDIRNRVTEQAEQKVNNVRHKASEKLRATSTKFQDMANYVEEHDARDMSRAVANSSRDLIRENPGKSMLAGLVLGLLIGRACSMGNHRMMSQRQPFWQPQFHPYAM